MLTNRDVKLVVEVVAATCLIVVAFRLVRSWR